VPGTEGSFGFGGERQRRSPWLLGPFLNGVPGEQIVINVPGQRNSIADERLTTPWNPASLLLVTLVAFLSGISILRTLMHRAQR
jgi:hypothetical protein